MAKLSESDVEHVAKLAKLQLTSGEVKKFRNQLGEILEYMEQLMEVDVAMVEPTSQTTGLLNVARDDEIDATRILSQEEVVSGTEKTMNGYFVVPALLDKNNE